MRQLKREVKIGNVTIGGNNPIAVQTMLNVPVEDIEGNVAQAKRCEAAGCQILRVTCPSAADAKCIEAVKNAVNIPIVADIHFDYKAALACADVGVDKIRINPGNIGDDDRVKAVVQACQQKNIPIRIGVNGGSLEKHILAKYGAPVPEAMVESALYHVRLLEKFDFNNIVISIKNSNVPRMMEAYRQLSAVTDYPLHVGVTEAGTYQMGLLKSGMGIGGMLLEGIGDTIRVSLAAEPEKEVEAGYNILRAVGFPVAGPEVITCPTCGRTQYPCTEIANEVEKRLQGYKKSIKVAVMGCVVNGPGEAREADIGIAGGKGEAVLFIHGQPLQFLIDQLHLVSQGFVDPWVAYHGDLPVGQAADDILLFGQPGELYFGFQNLVLFRGHSEGYHLVPPAALLVEHSFHLHPSFRSMSSFCAISCCFEGKRWAYL